MTLLRSGSHIDLSGAALLVTRPLVLKNVVMDEGILQGGKSAMLSKAACALETHACELKFELERCDLKSALGEEVERTRLSGLASCCSVLGDTKLRFECEREIGPVAQFGGGDKGLL
eukprot:CAMPEP_0180506892 /NCGR_PEP_ID=MMETSP1036_2-20121128/48258_1 /TAXON_ID=632150 /ORGANISM="Azadinium spinosum, Strain 3D9" /LENGTH=116 /DNA_ID=CAMNT_0022516917 /DNA_START=455 /DNA_END=803 /DNA_ORIENTATION=+